MADDQHPARVRMNDAIYGLTAVFVVVGFVALAKDAGNDDSTFWAGVLLFCLVALVVVLPVFSWLVDRWPAHVAADQAEDHNDTSG